MLRLSTILLLAAALITVGWFLVPKPAAPVVEAQERRPENHTLFATDRDPPMLKVSPAPFDGDRAMQYLKDVCLIGPRISATEGMKQQQAMLKKHFENLGGKVELQPFKAKQLSQKEAVDMTNLIVSFWPDRQRRVILCSHYDTRPVADQEPDPNKWRNQFLSANDGGSGVAFLMEMAQHIKDLNIKVGVDFVLFDGEEFIQDKGDKYFFGSDHFAKEYRKKRGKPEYVAAILLDMIAGKGARFPKEPTSVFMAGPLVESVWKVAREQNVGIFVQEQSTQGVEDDHVPLNRAGIPAIDIIDFSYRHWHRLSDTPAACSPESMVQVSKVLSVWLQRVKEK